MKVTIANPLLALDVQIAVSKEETRYYLNGFHVERADNGIILVSTDGHRMVVAHDRSGLIDAGITYPIRLPKELLKQIRQAVKNSPAISLVITGDASRSTATLVDKDGSTVVQYSAVLINGTFPDWRRVLPTIDFGKPLVTGTFNASYVADFGSLHKSKHEQAVTLYGNDESDPFLVKIPGRQDIFGVLMPRRDTGIPQYPEWLGKETIESKTRTEDEDTVAA